MVLDLPQTQKDISAIENMLVDSEKHINNVEENQQADVSAKQRDWSVHSLRLHCCLTETYFHGCLDRSRR